ncbi:hypothetical protein LCI18_013768 [Fusarium solani-melongenae]|uniref:Uncharacterized protein n=1 Tax=Fusarium solani subsp. cucurbitae TaxID=2747967 RepID=A0ACD3ZNC8_FUSSC|nr:hypothetical protein LCI18_013768 [Fusarium solani-melongenae]
MSNYQRIALVGAGLLGSGVLIELVNAGFDVTVLGRSMNRQAELPAGVRYSSIDYSSPDSLVSALRGHDAAILTHSLFGVHLNKPLIDASIKAGVRRIIPSHYGSVATSDDPEVRSMPVHATLIDIRKYLEEKAQHGEIEYTILEPGCFLETLVTTDTAIDLRNKRMDLWDDGNHRFSSSTLSGTGKAMVGVFRNASATKNRIIRFHEFTISQNEIFDLAKRYVAPVEKWTVNPVNSDQKYEEARMNLEKDPSFVTGFALLKICMMSGRWGVEYELVDNDVIGLELLPASKVEKAFQVAVEKHILEV